MAINTDQKVRFIIPFLVFVLLILFQTAAKTQAFTDYTKGLTIWFDTPTDTSGKEDWDGTGGGNDSNDPQWERKSLPVGNGSIGGSVMGSIPVERIVFNEKTLWKGGPNVVNPASQYWEMNKNGYQYLQQIQSAMVAGNISTADDLTRSHFSGNIDYEELSTNDDKLFGAYQTVGEFQISTGISETGISNYRRILSIDSALAIVQFEKNGTSYERKHFCSYPDSVLVIQFSANTQGMQNLDLELKSPHPVTSTNQPDGLLYTGKLTNNNQEFAVRVAVQKNSGTMSVNNGRISISGADEVTFIIAADTDYKPVYPTYNGVEPEATTLSTIYNAGHMTFNELFIRHFTDYDTLFGRVELNINPDISFDNVPTPNRLARYKSGTLDNRLEEMYFQFGRYLLIASSRPGNLPANLQGIWNHRINPPWNADNHNNINVQMNYWPAGVCNLNECHLPLITYIQTLIKPGEVTAQKYYNARGWTAAISGNIYGFTAPLSSSDMTWNYNPVAGPWLASHVWDYFDFTRDIDFLSTTGYELLKSSAQFTVDHLYKLNDTTYTATPSYSPEHGTIDLGCTYNHAVCRELLHDAVRASQILGLDSTERDQWIDVRNKISRYKIGQYGQLQEWFNDIDNPNDHHRHVNHLFCLYPGHDISPLTTPALASACETTLNQRGDVSTGWSMGWKINQWARLHDGNRSYKLYQDLLKTGTADNLWDMHPPFQIDGNFGGTAGVAEMLIQSHMGFIHLLPSLPDAWKKGSVKGFRARGAFEVDFEWVNNLLTTGAITSLAGDTCHLYYKTSTLDFPTVKGVKYLIRYDGVNLILDGTSDPNKYKAPGNLEKWVTCFQQLKQKRTICFRFNLPEEGNVQFTLYSINGKTVYKETFSNIKNGIRSVRLNNRANGVYLYTIEYDYSKLTGKVIVK